MLITRSLIKAFVFVTLAGSALAPHNANAADCIKGKPCGDRCISEDETCHIGSAGNFTNAPANEAHVPQTFTADGKVCSRDSKPCGNACIELNATCHTDFKR